MPKGPSDRAAKRSNGSLSLAEVFRKDSTDRRSAILRALCRLILKQGAASTSFSDVAREAGMTASHLHYYYESKDALLNELYHAFSVSLLSAIASNWNMDLSPEVRCKVVADNLFLEFSEHSLNRSFLEKIFFEMIAYAAHNPRVREAQQRHTATAVANFRQMFRQTPLLEGFSVDETAALVTALWTGMLVFSYFYEPLSQGRAKELFGRVLLHFCGFDGRDAPARESNAGDARTRLKRRLPNARSGFQGFAVNVVDSPEPSLTPMGIAI